MKRIVFAIASAAILFSACTKVPKEGVVILPTDEGGYSLYIDGQKTEIYGIGGSNRLSDASENGANSFRSWGGSVERIKKDIEKAAANNMYIMQGIGLSHKHSDYLDEEYKNRLREEVRTLAENFKDDRNILIWGIGNEIQLDGANGEAEWTFVNELSELIKSIDKRHLTSSVISHDAAALDSIAKYAPSLDLVGINSYGNIAQLAEMVDNADYKGPYLVTEWGPTGWWECARTEWGAPIEQTSEEKRQVYEKRYTQDIMKSNRCLGSYGFLWGQKEERTPTWFCMFVENNVEGLPLKGEKTPMVEAMQRVWTGREPEQTAPVVSGMTVNGKPALESPRVAKGQKFESRIQVSDKEGDTLSYVWELLWEATITAHGGAYEPRPERVGECVTTSEPELELTLDEAGNYRLYCYVLDGTGYVSTANVPFQVTDGKTVLPEVVLFAD